MESVQIKSRVQCQHLLSLKLPQVSHGQLQDVGLLQLADALSLGLQGEHHQILQLVQAGVDPGSPLPLQQGLHHLPVLVRPRQGFFFKIDFTLAYRRHLILV